MTNAIILAAGRGSRLGDMTEDMPKCRVRLGGSPLIERQIATYRRVGIDDVTIVTGYRADMLRFDGIRNAHNPAWETTNMVATLFCAQEAFGDDFIVSYSDIVYEDRVLRALLDAPGDISVIVDRKWRPYWEIRFENPLDDAESLALDAEGCITDIGRRVSDIDLIQAQYIGLIRFRGEGVGVLRDIGTSLGKMRRDWMDRRPIENAYMTDLLMEMILRGHRVRAVPIDGGWLEIDTPLDHALGEALFSGERSMPWFSPAGVAAP